MLQQWIMPIRRQYRLRPENVISVVEPKNTDTQTAQKQNFPHPATGRADGSAQRMYQPDYSWSDGKRDQRGTAKHHAHDKKGPQQSVLDQLGFIGNNLIAEIQEQQAAGQHIISFKSGGEFHRPHTD